MKKLGLLLGIFLVGQSAYSAYDVKAELELPNAKPNTGSIVMEAGLSETLSLGGEASLQFEIQKQGSDTVLISGQVYSTANGKHTLVAKPRVITKLGQAAEISQHSLAGELVFRLKVTPTETQ